MNDIIIAAAVTAFLLWGYKLLATVMPREINIRDANDGVIYILSILGAWFVLKNVCKMEDVDVCTVLLVAALADVFVFLREFLVLLADLARVNVSRRSRRA